MAFSFHVEHFGCRAARADGEAVSDRLRVAGLCEGEPSEADVVVVNTCSVTAEADRAARAFIRRAHRVNPEARIVVTGCYAQRAPGELAGMAGVAAVVGNSHKALAPKIVLGLAREGAGVGLVALPELVRIQSLAARRAGFRSDLGGRSVRSLVSGGGADCAWDADQAQPEDSGGMREPMRVLRDSADARAVQKPA
jgi:tRNA A37 methylthiotransferase MiaB